MLPSSSQIEAEAIKALDMIAEVDALIEEVSEKLHKAEKQLADIQDVAKSYRHTIKNNFPMEQWERFGIRDK